MMHVAFPLTIGLSLYIGARAFPPQIVSFISAAVPFVRCSATSLTSYVPTRILGSLPSGLWCYALVSALGVTWPEPERTTALVFSLGALCIGLAYEFGQAAKLVPGTFDWLDVGFTICGAALAVLTKLGVDRHVIKPKG